MNVRASEIKDLSRVMDLINQAKEYFKDNNINQWQRREFKDFDYLEVELSDTQYMWMFIITLIYSIGISIFIVMNNARNDEKNYKRNRYRY